jgi:hypothetical protein
MTLLQFPAKDSDEVLDYQIDWAANLAAGETISTSTFTVDNGLTIQSQSNTTTVTTVWLAAGTEGLTAKILNRVTTSGGRTMDQTVTLPIRKK